MNKKADLAWWHLMIILLAIALILFAIIWNTELGSQIKELIPNIFDIY